LSRPVLLTLHRPELTLAVVVHERRDCIPDGRECVCAARGHGRLRAVGHTAELGDEAEAFASTTRGDHLNIAPTPGAPPIAPAMLPTPPRMPGRGEGWPGVAPVTATLGLEAPVASWSTAMSRSMS